MADPGRWTGAKRPGRSPRGEASGGKSAAADTDRKQQNEEAENRRNPADYVENRDRVELATGLRVRSGTLRRLRRRTGLLHDGLLHEDEEPSGGVAHRRDVNPPGPLPSPAARANPRKPAARPLRSGRHGRASQSPPRAKRLCELPHPGNSPSLVRAIRAGEGARRMPARARIRVQPATAVLRCLPRQAPCAPLRALQSGSGD